MAGLPLLSIVMPTKNRSECARHAIDSILGFTSNDFELIVHDNSDDSRLAEWVAGRPIDSRLRYFTTRDRLSINQNFERAIERVRGEYVAALGDDDGVSPCVLDVCQWMKQNNIDALTSETSTSYCWPGVHQSTKAEPSPGRLVIGRHSGCITLSDPETGLAKCVSQGALCLENLPKLYHGVVRRSSLEKVYEQTGAWLPGISPDMAVSVALASHANLLGHIDYPVFVPGASPRSGAGRGLNKTHQGDLRSEAFLDSRYIDSWPIGVPEYFSGPTMWGAAAIQALQATNRTDMLSRFNYAAVHAACLVFVPSHRSPTWRSLASCKWERTTTERCLSWARCLQHIANNLWRRSRSYANSKVFRVKHTATLEASNIAIAMDSLLKHCGPLRRLAPVNGATCRS